MKLGDKVRFIHGKEQGQIVKLIDQKQVEVEIEDGFRIPVLKTELVVVASEEVTLISGNEIASEEIFQEKWNGVYVAFTSFNDQTYELNLINDTGYKMLFTIGEEKDNQYKGIYSGLIEKKSFSKLHELSSKAFENWPTLLIQMLFFGAGESEYRPPLVKKLNFRSATFFKNRKLAPILNKEAILYRLDLDALKIDAKSLEENMAESKTASSVIALTRPAKEIDLHIEKLTENHIGMSNTAILNLQMETFQKNFENAQATNMEEIIFIHGVGNGILKKEIHKVLSATKTIKFFQEAQKEKFGYGATLVRLK